ncbi:hypothetical protein GT755_18740 [Herbidospora sp. NEAU-GS84]|uniref:Uncharacterized protein n=1 Tax=Herbidospora solisilvae TaxID=2696284 RepID=A0A7C9JFF2_9ACTN|nr:hypothetical protein [Herbidospora solisilvae]NAS23723.1 hypothetical protein [Herbidospora solisilvae]
MPPNLDAYVWVADPQPSLLGGFIARYAAEGGHSARHLAAFRRAYVLGEADGDDSALLDELRSGDGSFTLYLKGRGPQDPIIALTCEGAAVLGLSVHAEDDLPLVIAQAEQLLDRLREELSAEAGIAGVELPPPRNRAEWDEQDPTVLLRFPDPAGRTSRQPGRA